MGCIGCTDCIMPGIAGAMAAVMVGVWEANRFMMVCLIELVLDDCCYVLRVMFAILSVNNFLHYIICRDLEGSTPPRLRCALRRSRRSLKEPGHGASRSSSDTCSTGLPQLSPVTRRRFPSRASGRIGIVWLSAPWVAAPPVSTLAGEPAFRPG